MSDVKKVPNVVIKRLPRYYRYLGDLLNQDIKRISSGALSKKMNVTASQIRQDFNYFGGFGQQGYGYNVEFLYEEIGKILGLDEGDTTIIIGAGNLGKALAAHSGFERRGFKIIGIFDSSPDVIGKEISGHIIEDVNNIEEFIRNNHVDIGILTVPKTAVHEIADKLVECGVKGILNFSYSELKLPDTVAVENVHISDPLMTLSYKLKRMKSE